MEEKEKNFEHVSLYLYDRESMEGLKKDFAARGFDSKSKYITSLIKSGLRKEQKKRAILADAIGSEATVSTKDAIENEIAKTMGVCKEGKIFYLGPPTYGTLPRSPFRRLI